MAMAKAGGGADRAMDALLRWLPKRTPPAYVQLATGVLAAALAAALRAVLPIEQAPFLLFVPAVLATSLWMGLATGLTCLATSILLGIGLFMGAAFSALHSPSQMQRTLLFAVVLAALALVAAFTRRTLLRLQSELERARALQAEAAERQRGEAGAEARYRSLFDAIDAGFCIVEVAFTGDRATDYRFLEVNPAFRAQTGLENAPGAWMRDLAPQHESAWFEAYGHVALTGEPLRFERHVGAQDGRWYDVHAFRIGEPHQRRVAILFNDVTERRRQEAAVRESEARFRLIADSAPVPIWVTRADRTREFVNRAYQDFLGLPYERARAFDWREVIHPEDAPRIFAEQQEKEALLEVFALEARYRNGEGEWRWLRSLSQPRWDAGGAFAGFIGVAYDVTLAREAADKLSDLNTLLEARVRERTRERDRLWALSVDLLVVADVDGDEFRANPSWTRLFGPLNDDAPARAAVALVHPDDIAMLREELARMRRLSSPVSVQLRLRGRDGGWLWIDWTLSPEADGRRFSGVGRDVTEAKAREAELDRVQESLWQARKMEAVGQLTGGIAHDFNNLLTVMRSSVGFLDRDDLPAERRRRYVGAIADTVERASRLTGQLLAFARRQPLKPEVFAVSEQVAASVDLIRPLVGPRVRVELGDAPPNLLARADVAQFENALLNLAANARDAMRGEGALILGVSAEGERGRVVVSVEDTGPGVPPEHRARIFEPFFTTKAVGKGTGLGLSQVFGFAQQSGGEVAIEEAAAGGARFLLSLPRAAERPAPPAPASPPASAAGVEPRPRGERVLVVEDDEAVGRFSTEVLEDLGYRTAWVTSGESALDLLTRDPAFDLVFTDVIMPGMSGVQLADALALAQPRLPVVLTSGYSPDLAATGLQGRELIRKPFSAADLAAALAKALGQAA